MDAFIKVDYGVIGSRDLLNVYDKMLYVVLCKYAHWDTGEAFPSIRRLADDMGVSTNTVRKSLKRLEELNLVSKQERKTAGGRTMTHLYKIEDAPQQFKQFYPKGWK